MISRLQNNPFPLTQVLANKPAETFAPLTDEFLEKAYVEKGMNLNLQVLCEVARKLHEAIKCLPLNNEEQTPAEVVLGTSTRVIAHNVIVQQLRHENLGHNPDAQQYIGWVKTATHSAVTALTKHLNNFWPLSKYYAKDPIRDKVDNVAGWSAAVTIPSTPEATQDKEEIFSFPLKLVCNVNPTDLRAYVEAEKARSIIEGDSHLRRSFSNNQYVNDAAAQLQVYQDSGPHVDKDGKVFGCLIEPRETESLKRQVTEKSLLSNLHSVKEANKGLIESEIDKKILVGVSLEVQRQAEVDAIRKIEQSVQQVVDAYVEISLTGLESQIVSVQDHYPVEIIGKIAVDAKNIQKLRNLVWKIALDSDEETAPDIKYPRITPYAKVREGWNLLGAETIEDHLVADADNEEYAEFVELVKIGVERYQQQKILDQKMKKRNINPLPL